jgi:hypothetical protein
LEQAASVSQEVRKCPDLIRFLEIRFEFENFLFGWDDQTHG